MSSCVLEDIYIKNNYNLKSKMNRNSKYTIIASLYILKRRYTKDNLAGNFSSIRENLEC